MAWPLAWFVCTGELIRGVREAGADLDGLGAADGSEGIGAVGAADSSVVMLSLASLSVKSTSQGRQL